MAVWEKGFQIRTASRIQLINITSQIGKIVAEGTVREGIATVFSPHTTTAIIINENEDRLVQDLETAIRELIPWDRPYKHNSIDDNAPSHIIGSFLGPSIGIPISGGNVSLGTWQSIFLVELDGPRNRQVKVKVVGE